MKRLILTIVIIFSLMCGGIINAENRVNITAEEFGPKIARMDFKLGFAAVKNNRKYENKILYIMKYQIVKITIKNNSENILYVNPNYFTLVSNKKRSYPYSSETHGFKDKIKFLNLDAIQSVNVYPGTFTIGFLLFDKTYKKERPKKLFFKNIENHIVIDIIPDKKVTKDY